MFVILDVVDSRVRNIGVGDGGRGNVVDAMGSPVKREGRRGAN